MRARSWSALRGPGTARAWYGHKGRVPVRAVLGCSLARPARPYRRRLHVRHRKYGIHAPRDQLGHADDPWTGLLLWWARRSQERPRDHDAELHLDGSDDDRLVGGRLLA